MFSTKKPLEWHRKFSRDWSKMEPPVVKKRPRRPPGSESQSEILICAFWNIFGLQNEAQQITLKSQKQTLEPLSSTQKKVIFQVLFCLVFKQPRTSQTLQIKPKRFKCVQKRACHLFVRKHSILQKCSKPNKPWDPKGSQQQKKRGKRSFGNEAHNRYGKTLEIKSTTTDPVLSPLKLPPLWWNKLSLPPASIALPSLCKRFPSSAGHFVRATRLRGIMYNPVSSLPCILCTLSSFSRLPVSVLGSLAPISEFLELFLQGPPKQPIYHQSADTFDLVWPQNHLECHHISSQSPEQ